MDNNETKEFTGDKLNVNGLPSPKNPSPKSKISTLPQGEGKRVAFTLAEVLITLGIIGIVAAMTMPTLIANYRKKVTLEKIKQTYSILNNTLERAKVDHGMDVNNWYIPNDTTIKMSEYFFETYMLPYLSGIRYCENSNCMQTKKYLSGRTYNMGTKFSVFLPNGAFVTLTVGIGNSDDPEGTQRVFIGFDIDGENGYNVKGKDIFEVELGGLDGLYFRNNADKNKFLPYYYSTSRPCDDYLKPNRVSVNACSKDAEQGGGTCLAYIYCNGWSFGDNYPW